MTDDSAPQRPLRVSIREATRDDADAWFAMRRALWPECPDAEHRAEIAASLRGEPLRRPSVVLLAESDGGEIVGFAEVATRAYAEGCTSSPVAYLEGWYVVTDARRAGVGAALVRAAEDWGRSLGCTEFASDADPENHVSASAHLAAGFEDAGLVRCFRKSL